MRYQAYRILTDFFTPFITAWLRMRLARGKEDAKRFGERFGYSKQARPPGVLLWIHAASVGEANSALPIIAEMEALFPDVNILLTTGTVTSASLIAGKQLKNVIHQYVPADMPDAVKRFLHRWKPDIGLWVESELWPNLVVYARQRGCYMAIVNGRMSEKSFDKWQKRAPMLAYKMMECFEIVFAQTEEDAKRFRALGAKDARCYGNIKFDAATLPCNESELFAMQSQLKDRSVWLAASTHDDEEMKIAAAHKIVANDHLQLLTIIVPRHPKRGVEIAGKLARYGNVSLRSRGDRIGSDTKFYIADTVGELGLFYRLSEIVFMGGSLVPHGGQNPLEPLRLRCAIIAGAHTENFKEMYEDMERLGICVRVHDEHQVAACLHNFLKNPESLTKQQIISRDWLEKKSGATARIIGALSPVFAPVENL